MKHSATSANCPLNTRYLLQQILAGAKRLHSDTRSEIVRYYDLQNISSVLACADEVREEKQRQAQQWGDLISAMTAESAGGACGDSTPSAAGPSELVAAGEVRQSRQRSAL
jgi:hypothetical protein